MKRTILTMLLISIVNSLYSQDITGQWNGVLKFMGNQLKLVFHIQKSDSGYTATFDSPDQGAMGIPFTSAAMEGNELHLKAINIGAFYKGTFQIDSLVGAWNQGGRPFPLTLYRKDVEKETYRRPQEPIKPYPYYEEKVTFKNEQDSLMLAGTLTLPKGDGKFPAVILISGSGAQNRNEEVFGHKPFLVLADYLTRHGIGVLRYDDRGTAASTGNFGAATSADFATDVLSALAYLKTRSEIDTENIGLIGHSEGGSIAPMVANQSDDISFMVLLAGTAVPGEKVSFRQAMELESLRTFDIQDSIAYRNFVNSIIGISSSDKSIMQKRKEMTSLYKSVQPFLKTILPEGTDIDEFINRTVNQSLSPWMQYFYNYNPADELGKITIPVLSLNGSNDVQVNARINQSAIQAALQKAGNDDYKIIEMEGLNHMFQESESGRMDEYAKIEQTFSPRALEIILCWIKEHVMPKGYL